MYPLIPAIFNSIALLVALCVQSTSSPLAGSWFVFHGVGCVLLLYNGKYPKEKPAVWKATLFWVIMLCVSTFLLASTPGAGQMMAFLFAAPSLALCLRKEHLLTYFVCFLSIITLFSLGLVLQELLNVQYTTYNVDNRRSWPMMDPNNAAVVVNMGLITCFYFWLKSDALYNLWDVLGIIFIAALYTTGSFAGIGSAVVVCSILLCKHYGKYTAATLSVLAVWSVVALHYSYRHLLIRFLVHFCDRFPIWEGSWPLLWPRWWGGLGLGSFGYYYQKVRVEQYTAGYFAHNDILQLAIEMGIPGAMVFCALILTVAYKTTSVNILPACALLAVFLQAMVEFQFYVPPISILCGLALACHILLTEKPKKGIML